MKRKRRTAAKVATFTKVVPFKSKLDRALESARVAIERDLDSQDPAMRFMSRVSLLFIDAANEDEIGPRELLRAFVNYAGFKAATCFGKEEATGIFRDGFDLNKRSG